jgi:hypothetical protein
MSRAEPIERQPARPTWSPTRGGAESLRRPGARTGYGTTRRFYCEGLRESRRLTLEHRREANNMLKNNMKNSNHLRLCAKDAYCFRILESYGELVQPSPFGARFGLSDHRARRTIVAPLATAQASARSPQWRGG